MRTASSSTALFGKQAVANAPQGALSVLMISTLLLLACLVLFQQLAIFSFENSLLTGAIWAAIVFLIWRGLPFHQHRLFGIANSITTVRALITAVLAGCALNAATFTEFSTAVWYLTGVAVVALALDGLDGWIARRSNLASAFGARFDMEIDALLILILTVLVWQLDKAGAWIVSLGLMRYAFIAAGEWKPVLKHPLYPSMRRKVVCVIQVLALCLMLVPWVQPPLSWAIGLFALICLCTSFARDTHWLLQHGMASQQD